ncbi:MAG: hypothetical protein WBE26_05210 [Phycisphaerae bacterium]
MPDNGRTRQRIDHLQGLLDTEYEKLHKLETDHALAPPGESRVSLELTLKQKIWPRIHELESELDELHAEVPDPKDVPQDEAETLCAELVGQVALLQAAKKEAWPDEILQKLAEIQEKLNEPGKAAAAKLQVSISPLGPIVAYNLELDTESTLVQILRKIRSLFRRTPPANP